MGDKNIGSVAQEWHHCQAMVAREGKTNKGKKIACGVPTVDGEALRNQTRQMCYMFGCLFLWSSLEWMTFQETPTLPILGTGSWKYRGSILIQDATGNLDGIITTQL